MGATRETQEHTTTTDTKTRNHANTDSKKNVTESESVPQHSDGRRSHAREKKMINEEK